MDLQEIVRRSAGIFDVPIEDAAAVEIASRSRGTPRVGNRLLRRVRDFAQVRADGRITREVALDALKMLDVDTNGFDEADRRLLHAIIDKFGGGPVGLNSIAAAISEGERGHRGHLRALSDSDRIPRPGHRAGVW